MTAYGAAMGGRLLRLGFFLIVGVGGFVWYFLDLFGQRLPSDNERAGTVTCCVVAALGVALLVIGALMVAAT